MVFPDINRWTILKRGEKKNKEKKDEGWLEKRIKEDYVKELEDGLVKLDYPTMMR